jgi:23S rRNA pseudouridine2605 synthase
MPRKSKKKAENAAVGETPAAGLHEPDEPELKTAPEAGTEAGKEAGAQAEVSPGADQAHAEAMAEAADTFEQAYEDRVPLEHPALAVVELIVSEAPETTEAGDEEIPGPNIGDPGQPEEPGGRADDRPPARMERLQKILSQAGVASRRHAEEMIVAGRVQVNGQVVTELGSKADPDRDHIRVDGKLLRGPERLRYFVLNKPKGFVTTVSDPEGRPTVMEFFKKMHERLYPVGRLDYQSEGLLVVTNDGELANKLTRPASGVERIYLV